MATEPKLTDEDRRIWQQWRRTCKRWAQSKAHRRRVLRAGEAIHEMSQRHPDAYVAWSGGKDSTALAHLVLAECGVDTHAMAICDDFDYPGEVDYLQILAGDWGVEVDIVEPDFSLQQWIADHADEIETAADLHSRASEFSDRAFYSLIDRYRDARGRPGVYLGLRTDESHGRTDNRMKRGLIYTKSDGEPVCQPIADWQDRDVYAYLFARDIPLLPVYQCVRLHDHPADIRKSWWLPHGGSKADFEGLTWLRTYWPSLYRRLCELLPKARSMA